MTTAQEPLLIRERDERGVIRLTMNRPQSFNPLSAEMIAALETEIALLGNDDGARVLVLAGAGRAFSAGHDLKQMRAAPALESYQLLFKQCADMMLGLQRLPIPVIARVHGIATAAGCQLVGMCDLAVAASDARFAVSGVKLGLFCSSPSVALARNVGRKAAFEMLVTGDFISAGEAMDKGLVNRVVPADGLDAEVERLCASIVEKPRVAVAMGKALFYRQVEQGIAAAYEDAARTMACNMMDESALEGVQAFIEKRPPRW